MAAIRERKRGVWEVRVFVGRGADGKPVQRSFTVRGGKKDAEAFAAEKERRTGRGIERRTVIDVLDAWRETKEPTWSAYSRRDQTSRSRAIAAGPLGGKQMARLEVADIDRWVAGMRRDGVGEGSIRSQLQTLRSALQQAVRWGWLSTNPAADASYAQPKRAGRGLMSVEDVQAVIAVADDVHPMAQVALRLAAATGARRGELAAVKWSDFAAGTLTIDSAISVVRDHPDAEPGKPVLLDEPTKTGDRRVIAVDAATAELIEARRGERSQLSPWMFSEDSDPPNPDRMSWWWKRVRKLSGIDKQWRLHDLRHWSATQALQAGYDVATVAGRLGHSDPSTTLRVYAHAVRSRDQELASVLGGVLDSEDASGS
jgi:integrase